MATLFLPPPAGAIRSTVMAHVGLVAIDPVLVPEQKKPPKIRSRKESVSGLSDQDLNGIIHAYLPLAKKTADNYWSMLNHHKSPNHERRSGSTQKRNTDSISQAELLSAANYGLCQAKLGWNPYITTCSQKCVLATLATAYEIRLNIALNGGTCKHGLHTYTYGAYALMFVVGAVRATIRKSYKRKPCPYTVELMPGYTAMQGSDNGYGGYNNDEFSSNYERLPDLAMLADGSDFDGQPGDSWSHVDMNRLGLLIDQTIESGKLNLSNFDATFIINGLKEGLKPVEIVNKLKDRGYTNITVRTISTLCISLRDLLSGSDFSKNTCVSESYSLPALAEYVTSKNPDRPCQPKRLGEWLARGACPGIKTIGGQWMISRQGAKIASRKWGEQIIDKTGNKKVF